MEGVEIGKTMEDGILNPEESTMKHEAKDAGSEDSYVPEDIPVSKTPTKKRATARNKKAKASDSKKTKTSVTKDQNKEKGDMEADQANASQKKGRKRAACWLNESDSETDGEEYVAAGSAFVGMENGIDFEDIEQDADASTADDDDKKSKVVVFPMSKEKGASVQDVVSQVEEDTFRDFSDTNIFQQKQDYSSGNAEPGPFANVNAMFSQALAQAQVLAAGNASSVDNHGLNPSSVMNAAMFGNTAAQTYGDPSATTAGMFPCNPLPIVDQASMYALGMMFTPDFDPTMQFSPMGSFGVPDSSFMNTYMTSPGATDADFGIASGGDLGVFQTFPEAETLPTISGGRAQAPARHRRGGQVLGGAETFRQNEQGRLEVGGYRNLMGRVVLPQTQTTINATPSQASASQTSMPQSANVGQNAQGNTAVQDNQGNSGVQGAEGNAAVQGDCEPKELLEIADSYAIDIDG